MPKELGTMSERGHANDPPALCIPCVWSCRPVQWPNHRTLGARVGNALCGVPLRDIVIAPSHGATPDKLFEATMMRSHHHRWVLQGWIWTLRPRELTVWSHTHGRAKHTTLGMLIVCLNTARSLMAAEFSADL